MTFSDVVLFALDHPTVSVAGLSFVGGASLGFIAGRRSRREIVPDASRRIDPRF